ncbi:peptide deformylase [Syntrophus aciditrophicus]|jgi:peptide deformylase|uniref:Peptide deformylase n=1 Tax=Syntrophus aciditrophicus (strain SB) TaxID=56780 RepID=Q2LWW1_SYNAS|nr:peptide deformylase [Syntrophus aciditrophicus]ABC78568.1 peptide deformylase [Syntrophus aciditrophicus SB]OPY16539.1 MAG: Peptide deformylase 2 [Syntrophus sp. PtaB.Bin075]
MSYRHKVLTLWSEISVNDEETRILRTPSRDLPIPLSREARDQIQTLVDAFLERDDALGLAAPQIGINRRIVIFRNKGFDEEGWSKKEKDYDLLINPRITQTRGELVKGAEGCLSCPSIQVEVNRFPEVKVRAFDRHGNRISKRYADFLARVAQHELDHLEGKLIVDCEGPVYFPREKKAFFERIFAQIP